MTIPTNKETISVKDLIEIFKNLPEDYRLDVSIKYQNLGDYGDRWRDMCTCDIDTIEVDDENKTVTIKAWE